MGIAGIRACMRWSRGAPNSGNACGRGVLDGKKFDDCVFYYIYIYNLINL
jgi:hypothetical protein